MQNLLSNGYRGHSVKVAYICCLKICCLVAGVVSLFVSRLLLSNGLYYNMNEQLVHGICIFTYSRHRNIAIGDNSAVMLCETMSGSA
jgi:hypothetical protein